MLPLQETKVKTFAAYVAYVAKQKRYKWIIKKMKNNRETITTSKIMSAW